MNFKDFFNEFNLHDSVVDNCQYCPQNKKLILTLEICNYMQSSYQDNESEIIAGKLIFNGVQKFVSQPSIEQVNWGKKMNGEILDVDVLNPNNFQQEIEIILEVTDYLNQSEKIYKLEIIADKAEWIF